mgnify:CR=1 FL=1
MYRAQALTAQVLHVLSDTIAADKRRDAYERLLEMFHTYGFYVVNDADRRSAGLSLRNDKGWTLEELAAYECATLDALLKPIYLADIDLLGDKE